MSDSKRIPKHCNERCSFLGDPRLETCEPLRVQAESPARRGGTVSVNNGNKQKTFSFSSHVQHVHKFSPVAKVAIAKGSKGPFSVYKSRSRALHSATPLGFDALLHENSDWKRLQRPETWNLPVAGHCLWRFVSSDRNFQMRNTLYLQYLYIQDTLLQVWDSRFYTLILLDRVLMTPKLALFREGNKWAGQKKQLSRSSDQQLPSPSRFQAVLTKINFRFSSYVV